MNPQTQYQELLSLAQQAWATGDEGLLKQSQSNITNFIRTFVYEASVARKVFQFRTISADQTHRLPDSMEPGVYIDVLGTTEGEIVALGGPAGEATIQPQRSLVAFQKLQTKEHRQLVTTLKTGAIDLINYLKTDFAYVLAKTEDKALFTILDYAANNGGSTLNINAGTSFDNFVLEYEHLKPARDALVDNELVPGIVIMHDKLFDTLKKHDHSIIGTNDMGRFHEEGLAIHKRWWNVDFVVTIKNIPDVGVDENTFYVVAPEDYLGRAFLFESDAIYWEETRKDYVYMQSWEHLAMAVANPKGVVKVTITYS